MFPRSRYALLVLVACCGVLCAAQVPEKFTNLQFFPKDIPHDDLVQIMRGFSFSLNVRCQYCHAGKEGDSLRETNFASDEKETKKTARAMLRMVDAINQQYISKLESKTSRRVECVTCHHGVSKPVAMNILLAETMEKKDLEAALTLYRDLRKRVYGSGEYDFGETPLNQLTESLLKQHKTKEAAAIMELNVEVNTPPSMWTRNLLAMAHSANKDTEKAKADFQKILEIDPQNAFAKKQLEQLSGVKP
ncbi:MAG TPA: c-type cytochrome [Terriglobales bacterium]|nr:c-type cytochrome [Terriglobales bacterium]